LIDSHTHTRYSKHAVGTVDELAAAALQRNVKVLTITDHAPFFVDEQNRLLEDELRRYVDDIERVRQRYAGRMKILTGMEFDFMPGSEPFLSRLLDTVQLDYVIGSIHYIPLGQELVKVWDLPRLNEQLVLDSYFRALRELLTSNLFDAVGHADTLLRAVPESVLFHRLDQVLPLFAGRRISYELNASGLRKSIYNPESCTEQAAGDSYPSRRAVSALLAAGASFTIGSDAHDPRDVGAGIIPLLEELAPLGLHTVSYYEKRTRIDVSVPDILMTNRTRGDRFDGATMA